jgi:3'-phosphoadenosine 5'-phosphosulfate sulfotransferase (PAPS reductase)/FAD synthetase
VAKLGLTDVRAIRPSGAQLAAYDPEGKLWQRDPDLCCSIRKTNPLDAALEGFEAWITGRKRSQGGSRTEMEMVDTGPDGRITVNPLAFWNEDQINDYFARHDLPRHPLQAEGYASIGCATCTQRVQAKTNAPAAGPAWIKPNAASTCPVAPQRRKALLFLNKKACRLQKQKDFYYSGSQAPPPPRHPPRRRGSTTFHCPPGLEHDGHPEARP